MATRDYYDILGVNKKASDEELKKLIAIGHEVSPEQKSQQEGGEERFKELNEAYAVFERQREAETV